MCPCCSCHCHRQYHWTCGIMIFVNAMSRLHQLCSTCILHLACIFGTTTLPLSSSWSMLSWVCAVSSLPTINGTIIHANTTTNTISTSRHHEDDDDANTHDNDRDNGAHDGDDDNNDTKAMTITIHTRGANKQHTHQGADCGNDNDNTHKHAKVVTMTMTRHTRANVQPDTRTGMVIATTHTYACDESSSG